MTQYSVAPTNDELSSLIDKAIAGEEIILVQSGKPAVELRVVPATPAPAPVPLESRLTNAEWMERLRVLREALPPSPISAVDLVRQMRDEGP